MSTEQRWLDYFAVTANRPAHPLFDLLDDFIPDGAGRTAIDLGCGPGRGTLRLLARGYQVTAVDVAPEALSMLRERAPSDAPLEIVQSSFENLELETYDLAVGCFSLFFLNPSAFDPFWERLVASLKPGAIWAGEFLGVNDTWKDDGLTTHSREDVERLLSRFDVLHLKEEEADGQTAIGETKHWHVFHSIARLRG
jgi:tellurite methyltransferase